MQALPHCLHFSDPEATIHLFSVYALHCLKTHMLKMVLKRFFHLSSCVPNTFKHKVTPLPPTIHTVHCVTVSTKQQLTNKCSVWRLTVHCSALTSLCWHRSERGACMPTFPRKAQYTEHIFQICRLILISPVVHDFQ